MRKERALWCQKQGSYVIDNGVSNRIRQIERCNDDVGTGNHCADSLTQ